MMNGSVVVFFFLVVYVGFPQETMRLTADTLQGESYGFLYDRIRGSDSDSVARTLYLRAYMTKARTENNWGRIVQAYKNYLHSSFGDAQLIYGDSMVQVAKRAEDPKLLGSAHLTLGGVYYNLKKYREALDHYLRADELITGTDDLYLKYKVKFNIALVKYNSEHYDEAISLLTECRDYFKTGNARGYLNTLHLLGRCYNRMGNFGFSSEMNILGIEEGRRLDNTSMEVYFIQSEGINHCLKFNYALAIQKLDSTLKVIRKEKNDFANEVLGEFYLGKSHWGLGKRDEAVAYFKKVDSTFRARNYIKHEFLEAYACLSRYYALENNLESQFLYLQRQLKAQEILHIQDKYLDNKVNEEYDMREVKREKERVESLLRTRDRWEILGGILLIFLCLLIGWLLYRDHRNKKVYRKRFEALMEGKGFQGHMVKRKPDPAQKPDISQEVIHKVLKQLEGFERKKGFLDNNLSLFKLAAIFEVNNRYLSRIILYQKGKGVVDYLNDLRVDYIFDLLKKDRRYRNYSYQALAKEAGFSGVKGFSNAFRSRVGMTPSFFIEEMKRKAHVE
ncbi:AraC-type DNA-binding protein [Flagellimonas taeanensis]|uniref:AraC-type DNA-binding protein n=2 Tax=Flagellimonas taeanensis TaxID=1005926 RepID=A0A1M6SC65_9FLAO|nr:AraC-type DNA-binding protein [Allomuricauda taeanensis]SHK42266.1 AraC-type DNA-binding protein [Allomuricauda taeanensis]